MLYMRLLLRSVQKPQAAQNADIGIELGIDTRITIFQYSNIVLTVNNSFNKVQNGLDQVQHLALHHSNLSVHLDNPQSLYFIFPCNLTWAVTQDRTLLSEGARKAILSWCTVKCPQVYCGVCNTVV